MFEIMSKQQYHLRNGSWAGSTELQDELLQRLHAAGVPVEGCLSYLMCAKTNKVMSPYLNNVLSDALGVVEGFWIASMTWLLVELPQHHQHHQQLSVASSMC